MNRHFRNDDPLPQVLGTPERVKKELKLWMEGPQWRPVAGRQYLETNGKRMRYVPPEPKKEEKKIINSGTVMKTVIGSGNDICVGDRVRVLSTNVDDPAFEQHVGKEYTIRHIPDSMHCYYHIEAEKGVCFSRYELQKI